MLLLLTILSHTSKNIIPVVRHPTRIFKNISQKVMGWLVAFEGRVVWQWMHAGVVGAAALHVAHHFYMCFILEEEQEAEKESVQPLVV